MNGSGVLFGCLVVLVQVCGTAVGVVDLMDLVRCHQIVHTVRRIYLVGVRRLMTAHPTICGCDHGGGGCRYGVLKVSRWVTWTVRDPNVSSPI